jgi:hypothetical protein
MSYFNSAFQKAFVGTGGFTDLAGGKLGTPTNILATGDFAFVDPKTWILQDITTPPTGCCPLVLAAGSLYEKDKVGSHGGYLESSKSKIINPKYVSKFYRVDPNDAQPNVIHVGDTPFTNTPVLTITNAGVAFTNGTFAGVATTTSGSGTGLTVDVTIAGGVITLVEIANPGTGYENADTVTITDSSATTDAIFTLSLEAGCRKEFLCDETYNLRIDVKGSPVLRFLNRNSYVNADAYSGCCPVGATSPTVVDGTLVMIAFAERILDNALVAPFVAVVVTAEDKSLWYAPGTDTSGLVAPTGYTIGGTWDDYDSVGHTVGGFAGLTLTGAYVDTKFGDCTFQPSDFYEKEPVKLYASLVDENGDPCEFEKLCVVTECQGLQAMGLGESVLRDVVLSESYAQNFLSTDLRIREITQGGDMLNAISRTSSYTRYYLQHNVPRFNNPSGVFDNDQYLLEIITDGIDTNFEDFVTTWLDNCGTGCEGLEINSAVTVCVPVVPLP